MPIKLILNVGRDPFLLDTRSSLLRAAGYIVESVLSTKDAITHFLAGDFDLVLLCHTIPQEDKEHLACLLRSSGSQTPIVSVSRIPEHSKNALIDMTVESDPKKLLAGMKEILAKTPNSAGRWNASREISTDRRRLPHRTILCIDDDPNLLAIRRRILENAGYTVLTADGGAAGLRTFSIGGVDLVLLDYSMPIMNGGVVAALFRQIRSDIPLFLVSGCTTIPEEDLALFDRFIPKGVPANILLLALEETFAADRKPPHTESAQAVQSMHASHAVN